MKEGFHILKEDWIYHHDLSNTNLNSGLGFSFKTGFLSRYVNQVQVKSIKVDPGEMAAI